MECPPARQRDIGRGQQHGKLVFVVLMLVADLEAGMKQVPSVVFLDQRQVLQRARRVLPGEEEIRIGAVMHRANFDPGFAPCRRNFRPLRSTSENGLAFRHARSEVSPSRIGTSPELTRWISRRSPVQRSVATMSEAPAMAVAAATTNGLACSVGFRDFAGPVRGRRRISLACLLVADLGPWLQRMG
jgi:hypothetical protein